LIKNRDSLLTFLYHLEVPPDNNGSERAIRNAKVKMKISNQFKTIDFGTQIFQVPTKFYAGYNVHIYYYLGYYFYTLLAAGFILKR